MDGAKQGLQAYSSDICLIPDQLSECGGLEDELEGETTDAETESEEEEDIVLVEKKRVKSAFLDDEAEVSDDGEESDDEDDEVDDIPRGDSEATSMTAKSTFEGDEADGEGSGGEDETEDDMPHGESQAAGMTVKSSFEDDEADVPAEHSDESKMSPTSEQAIPHNNTVQETDETMASTQQLSGNLLFFSSKSIFFKWVVPTVSCTEIIKLLR
jgi:hypothetical protein